MKKKVVVTCVIIGLIFFYFATSLYTLYRSSIEDLLIVCLNGDPFHSETITEWYLLNYRGNEKDIELLRSKNGLSFVLNSTVKSRSRVLKYAEFLIDKGLDINAIGMDGLAPIHSAVMFNNIEDVQYLIEKGVELDKRIGFSRIYGKKEKTSAYGLTPIELIEYMSNKDGKDRSEVKALLDKM